MWHALSLQMTLDDNLTGDGFPGSAHNETVSQMAIMSAHEEVLSIASNISWSTKGG
jgi:hypothetical protein